MFKWLKKYLTRKSDAKRPAGIGPISGQWAVVLSKCDLMMARDEIADYLRLASKGAFASEDVRRAIEKGEGAIYYAPEYVEAWEAFRDNPNIETAKAFLKISPPLLRYFEVCSPGHEFYERKRLLKESGWVRSPTGGYERRPNAGS